MDDVDPCALRWAERYKELRDSYLELLGGKSASPVQIALAENLAVLGSELNALKDRLAVGRGSSAADIQTFIKLSEVISAALHDAGISPAKQQAIANSDNAARAKLAAVFEGIIAQRRLEEEKGIAQRRLEESRGIFRDCDDAIITPDRLMPDHQVPALPSPAPFASSAPAAPPAPRLVAKKAPPPAPIERSTTQKYYDWLGAGGGGGGADMSPDPSWPRLR